MVDLDPTYQRYIGNAVDSVSTVVAVTLKVRVNGKPLKRGTATLAIRRTQMGGCGEVTKFDPTRGYYSVWVCGADTVVGTYKPISRVYLNAKGVGSTGTEGWMFAGGDSYDLIAKVYDSRGHYLGKRTVLGGLVFDGGQA